jgi:hypothetical protein
MPRARSSLSSGVPLSAHVFCFVSSSKMSNVTRLRCLIAPDHTFVRSICEPYWRSSIVWRFIVRLPDQLFVRKSQLPAVLAQSRENSRVE